MPENHGAFTIADLLVGTVTILGASIAAGHNKNGVGAGLEVRTENRLDHPVLQLGQTLIALFFRNLSPVYPGVVSVF